MVEPDGKTARSGRDTKDRIDAEHHTLRGLVDQIDGSRDLASLVPLLGELRRLLEEHFAHEEEADGMTQLVRSVVPQHMSTLDALFDEHRVFLTEVDTLRERVRACLDGPMREIFDRAHDLAQRLHDHEARETGLLSDAMYEDEGGGD